MNREDLPKGPRWESAWLATLLVLDLLSVPFHALCFTLTRGRQRAAFRRALEAGAPAREPTP